jgi:Xaa-Pro aminopeptidase
MNLKYDFANDAGSKQWKPLEESLTGLENAFRHLDAVILTSKDPFISEYVPLENNPRFGATRFTGSVGDAIYFTESFRKKNPGRKPVALFVDGRYHLQADQETDSKWVEVVKLDVEPNIQSGVQSCLEQFHGIRVGVDFERTSVSGISNYRQSLSRVSGELHHIEGTQVLKSLGLPGWVVDRPIFSLTEKDTGRTLARNLRALTLELHDKAGHGETMHLTAATDDAAFLLNARGYHLPHTASFLAYTFLVKNECVVFLPECSSKCEVNLESAQIGEFNVRIIRNSIPELKAFLKNHSVRALFFNGSTMNALLPEVALELFPEAKVFADFNWVIRTRARKTVEEMVSIRSSFIRSSKAIAKTLRFGKRESLKRRLSEVDLASYLYESYAAEGAVALSFKTISGAGANSAIVHYSNPSATQYFDPAKLALLDSGAYYEEGFCTDCTRGFFVGGGTTTIKPEAWQKEIYTAALKSAIQVFLKPVDARLSGKEVDAMIRGRVKEAGYDYMHGTGHGIGIHVHEEGIRFSTLSVYPQSAFACVSVEPGIYLKDKGGVRIENVVLLMPEGEGAYRYDNLVFVGYDWDLVDVSKLNSEEKQYLKEYEQRCRELGTQLTECPL